MSGHHVLVGVDGSEESIAAAKVGLEIARVTGAECHLVHAIRDVWGAVRRASLAAVATAVTSPVTDVGQLDEQMTAEARAEIKEALSDALDEGDYTLTVGVGRAAKVLSEQADERGARLIVVGGKHHEGLGRWLGGSTAHHLIHLAHVPVLVTGETSLPVRRIVAAVDLTEAAATVIAAAESFAETFGAELRVMHVVEVLPVEMGFPIGFSQDEFQKATVDALEESVWPAVRRQGAERVMRQGEPVQTIEREVREWNADLLVVGGHATSWVGARILAHTTESLLGDLPTTTLVVPVVEREAASG